ncbi:MAG: ABC transporter substrate-binding protein [Deltaproteobacteria bacterium]|nr:ABC transporter substrate-binding protein [Deltaproteobacteria bacterium]
MSSRFVQTWALVALTLALPFAAHASNAVVAVVQSDALESYQEVVTGFAAQAPDLELARFSLDGNAKKADEVMDAALKRNPAVILALGPLAANAAKRATTDVPIVFAMVPNYEKYGLEAKNVTGIALTRPLEDQLGAVHALLPNAKKVGVLYTPELTQPLVDQAGPVAQKLGLSLKAEKLGKREVPEAAAALAGEVDAVWLIADRGTATVAATSALVAACKKAKVPLFALTEGQVREGALTAFTANPLAIGNQAGRLASRIAVEHVNPGALAVMPPGGLDVWVNLSTTRTLALDAQFSARVLDYAGQKGLAVRAIP